MAIQIVKAGPYFSGTSEISFSQIRQNFRAQNPDGTFDTDNAEISMSSLYRNTSTDIQDPVVPDSTENRLTGPADLPPADKGVPSSGEFAASKLRSSIKYYSANQTGTDLNVDIDNLNWNNNLEKNIRKFANVNGIVGSSDPTLPAATFDADCVNFTIQINGSVLAAGGVGVAGTYGTDGGTAIVVNSPTGKNNVINMGDTGKLYGGGGGGGAGGSGGAGGVGGLSVKGCNNGPCDLCGSTPPGTGGTGGIGGAGGPGRGFNNQSGSLEGSDGEPGKNGTSAFNDGINSGPGGKGGTGGTGGDGGDYALEGSVGDSGSRGSSGSPGYVSGCTPRPANPGQAGGSGRSGVRGGIGGTSADGVNNFGVIGTINSNTIRGVYF